MYKAAFFRRKLTDADLVGYTRPNTGDLAERYIEEHQFSPVAAGAIGLGAGAAAGGVGFLTSRLMRTHSRLGRYGVPLGAASAVGLAAGLLARRPSVNVFDPETGQKMRGRDARVALGIRAQMDPDHTPSDSGFNIASNGLNLGGSNDPDFAWIADLDSEF